MATNTTHRVKLTLGDWSRDGHNISEDIYVMANMTGKEIEKAYKKGTKKLGFDFSETVCADYQDSSISEEDFEKLKAQGYVPRDSEGEEFELEESYGGDGFCLDQETFADIFMFIAKLGNPDLDYKFAEEDHNNTIHVGGYGLFSP